MPFLRNHKGGGKNVVFLDFSEKFVTIGKATVTNPEQRFFCMQVNQASFIETE